MTLKEILVCSVIDGLVLGLLIIGGWLLFC